MNHKLILPLILLFCANIIFAQQADRWQQRVEYQMDINVDVENHQYDGKQTLTYYNNSPDELSRVFYHLFFNAFQPNSMMDVRSRTIADADSRVGSRISKLKDNEIGYIRVGSLTQDGEAVDFEEVGTILEVDLAKPIPPGGKTTFVMEWKAQVPRQVRRSGWMSKEGIELSMTQWYPKMCEYDYMGWHANPYVGREFHAPWGDFDVKITIDKDYIIGGTGYLQNPNEIGHGYETNTSYKAPKGETLTWHFLAPQVHDFAWAADPDYKHLTAKVPDGPTLHFFYQPGEKTDENWSKLPDYTVQTFEYISENHGKYPYDQYTVIQGGDGGMEYPMTTLITGERPLTSLVGVTVHEVFHTWYQMLMASNESLYAWMDEGFTSYSSNRLMQLLFDIPGDNQERSYMGYFRIAESGMEEPMSTHSDHFKTNAAYGTASYSKGAVFMHQLSYVIGQDALDRGLLAYYDKWKFKHPNPNDFIRVMEKESGLELDWYLQQFTTTTNQIDYAVNSVKKDKRNTIVELQRIGDMMMPIDVLVETKKGDKTVYHIPLRIMRGEKPQEDKSMGYEVVEDWAWTHPTYELVLPERIKKVKSITIDPTNRMADVDRDNNTYGVLENVEEEVKKKKKN